MKPFTLLLRGGRVVDPRNKVDGLLDVGISGARVAAVGPELDPAHAERVLDLTGQVVFPGVIDAHVHLSPWSNGAAGHQMLARAGTVTALECAGPLAETMEIAAHHGAGLNVACIDAARPGYTLPSADPPRSAITDFVERALAGGAIGVKLLGGHFPLSPECNDGLIDAAASMGAYCAFHAGSTRVGTSSYRGFEDALAIINGRRIHLAHVNAYSRGWVTGDHMEETRQMLRELEAADHLVTESHLAVWNGTLAPLDPLKQDEIEDAVTRRCLEAADYPPTADGIVHAIMDGVCQVYVDRGDDVVRIHGRAGVDAWRADPGGVTVGFEANQPLVLFATATARRRDGGFVVDALASDGGGIPRNFLVTSGLALVRFGALSLSDLATKIAWAPALMLGLEDKGHLAVGADADVTAIDPERGRATLGIAGGRVIMANGAVVGSGTTWITTPAGAAAAKAAGLTPALIEPATWQRYRRVSAA
ncbi:MAG: amidohydrolase [Chloroflexota bacterium]